MPSAVLPASALALVSRPASSFLPTGVTPFDALHTGVPRGAITEVYGAPSSGRTSLMMSIFAKATGGGEICALVDTANRFDPACADRAGVVIPNLLWVRCNQDAGAAFKAADILLHGGGFGVICLDLADVPAKVLNRLPTSYWFRFRLAIENTPTVLLVIGGQPNVRSCASCSVECAQQGVRWTGSGNMRLLSGIHSELSLRKPARSAVSVSYNSLNLRPDL